MDVFTIAEGRLWGTVLGGILYGLYIACFLSCLHLYQSRLVRRTWQNSIIFGTITVMFCLSTIHLACNMQALRVGFFEMQSISNANAYFNNRSTTLNLVIKSVNGLNMLLGDCLMLFRLLIIYHGNLLVMALPIATTLTTSGIVFVLVWYFSRLTPQQNSFTESVMRLAPAAFILPVVTNVLITGLILYKIITIRAVVRRLTFLQDDSVYHTIIANIVESCFIYPVVLTVALILYLCHSNGQDVLTGILPHASTLLWVLVHRGSSRYDMAQIQASSSDSRSIFAAPKKSTLGIIASEGSDAV